MVFWFFFWIIILIIDLIICPFQIIGSQKLRSSKIYGTSVVIILLVSRFAIIIEDPSHYLLPYFLNLIIGIPMFIIGGLLIVIALVKMKIYSLSGTSEGEPLNTTGIYGWIRHPIYLGEILWPLGLVLIIGKVFSAFIMIALIFYFIGYAKLEERKLIEIHGQPYKDYQDQVPMLFPIKLKKKGRNNSKK